MSKFFRIGDRVITDKGEKGVVTKIVDYSPTDMPSVRIMIENGKEYWEDYYSVTLQEVIEEKDSFPDRRLEHPKNGDTIYLIDITYEGGIYEDYATGSEWERDAFNRGRIFKTYEEAKLMYDKIKSVLEEDYKDE